MSFARKLKKIRKKEEWMKIFSVKTKNENETMLVGEKFASVINKGDIILLSGDLGAGKTHFVKGFAVGMGCKSMVTSPTFTILNVYEGGKMPIYHFDMYRLSSKEEAEELGFEEYFDHNLLDGVCLVEWPEQVSGLLNGEHYNVTIKKGDGENEREIIVEKKK